MRLAEVLQQTAAQFSNQFNNQLNHLEDSKQEARELVLQVLDLSLTDLTLRSDQILTPQQIEKVSQATQRRKAGEPLAYIVGTKDFYKFRFYVDGHVLIPRSETALIVEEVLQNPQITTIADLGSGSGCILLSVLKELPQTRGWALEKSPEALSILQKNAQSLGVVERVTTILGDVVDAQISEKMDVIVSNPPYIAVGDERLAESVKKYEPHLALYAGEEGLQCYKTWTPWAYRHLKPGGKLLYEVGQDQAQDVASICLQNGFKNIKIIKDLSLIERVVMATKE